MRLSFVFRQSKNKKKNETRKQNGENSYLQNHWSRSILIHKNSLLFTKNGGVFEVPPVIIYELETKKATISPCHDNEDISRLCNLGKLFLLQYQPLSNTNPCHYKSCIFLNGRKNYNLFLRY